MKMTSPLYSLKAWKSLSSNAVSKLYHVEGSAIFRRERNYTQLEKYFIPFNPQTIAQQENRSRLKWAVASWQGLPDESKLWWEDEQVHHRKHPVMSGYNLYIRKFMLGKEHDHGLP
jgi:hypothetical protein